MPKDPTNHRVFNCDKYKLHGKELKKEEALKYPIMAAGDGLPEENVVYLFNSHQEFVKWSRETKHVDRVTQALEKIERIKQSEKEDNSAARQRQEKLAGRMLEDLEALSERTGLPVSSSDLLIKASDDSQLLERRIFDHSSMLWELSGGRGAAWPVAGAYPDLNWFQWGNRAVSINANGVNILTDNPWYGGQWLVLFGFLWPLFELNPFGFAFRTEAIFS
jgi:hypothetical protein